MPIRRTPGLAAVAALLATAAVANQASPRHDWLSGRWCAAQGSETIEETWLPPRGGMLMGLSRTYTDEATSAFEYLRIVENDGTLEYVAQPGGRPPTAFRLTASGENWVRFENPAHDFPRRIEYRREGERLHAEIAGPGDGGAELVIPFDYGRCGD
jgi:hypothetical protein